MPRVVFTVVILLIAAINASAQSQAPTFNSSAAAVVGSGTTWDDEGKIGTGVLVGARAQRRLFGDTFVEGSLDRLHHERSGGFNAEGNTMLFTAAIVQHFGTATLQPYALAGLSVARHSGTYGFLGDSKVSLAESTDLGYVFGGGVAVRIGSRFEVGPEARFYVFNADNDSSPAFASWIGVRAGVRF